MSDRDHSLALSEPARSTPALARLPGRVYRRVATEVKLTTAARKADAFLVSYPKSGRTWFRFILANYLNLTHGLNLDIDLSNMFALAPNHATDDSRGVGSRRSIAGAIPLVLVSHAPYSRRRFLNRPMMFMIRDPKDVMVSAYFHASRHKHTFKGNVGAFIRDPELGLPNYVAYLNGWGDGLNRHRSLVLSYEHLKADAPATVVEALNFLGWPVNATTVDQAVAASSMDRMRALEVATGIPDHQYDRTDPDSRRVRRGEVGGYRNELSTEDAAWIDAVCAADLKPSARRLLDQVDAPIGELQTSE